MNGSSLEKRVQMQDLDKVSPLFCLICAQVFAYVLTRYCLGDLRLLNGGVWSPVGVVVVGLVQGVEKRCEDWLAFKAVFECFIYAVLHLAHCSSLLDEHEGT